MKRQLPINVYEGGRFTIFISKWRVYILNYPKIYNALTDRRVVDVVHLFRDDD